MPLSSSTSPEAIRDALGRAHAAVFGTRDDEALTTHLAGTAQSLATIAERSLGAFDAEPDFITGSSEKEVTA